MKKLLVLLASASMFASVAMGAVNTYTGNLIGNASHSTTATTATTAKSLVGQRRFPATLFGATESHQGANANSFANGSSFVTNIYYTPFSAADVGKLMMLCGGRADGLDLVGTIISVPSTSVVQLSTNCTASGTNVPVQWGFDDTAAIQAGLTYCATNGGGVLVLTNNCVIAGPIIQPDTLPDVTFFQSSGPAPGLIRTNHNAQLYVQSLSYWLNITPVIGFEGTASPIVIPSSGTSPDFIFGGAGLVSFLSTTNGGSLFDGTATTIDTPFGMNPFRFYAKDCLFRVSPHGNLTGLQLRGTDSMDLDNVVIDRGWQLYNAPMPRGTVSNSFALVTPVGLNSGGSRLHKMWLVGFYNGMSLGEHIVSTGGIEIFSCYNAMIIDTGGHLNVFDLVDAEDVNTYFNCRSFDQPNNHLIVNLAIENVMGGTWSSNPPPTLITNCFSLGGSITMEAQMYGTNMLLIDPHTCIEIRAESPRNYAPKWLTSITTSGNMQAGGQFIGNGYGLTNLNLGYFIAYATNTPVMIYAYVTNGVATWTTTPNGPINWMTSFSGTARNNVAGTLGGVFVVGTNDIYVTKLGRYIFDTTSTQTHRVGLWNYSKTLLGTTTNSTAGNPIGFSYVALSAPVVLLAGSTNYIASEEFLYGDYWADVTTSYTTTTAATNMFNAYISGGFEAPNIQAAPNSMFVGVSFIYQ